MKPSEKTMAQAVRLIGSGNAGDIAEALTDAHEAGRTEMSDAIAGLMKKYLGVEPEFGWGARIVSLGVGRLRIRHKALEEAVDICEAEAAIAEGPVHKRLLYNAAVLIRQRKDLGNG